MCRSPTRSEKTTVISQSSEFLSWKFACYRKMANIDQNWAETMGAGDLHKVPGKRSGKGPLGVHKRGRLLL